MNRRRQAGPARLLAAASCLALAAVSSFSAPSPVWAAAAGEPPPDASGATAAPGPAAPNPAPPSPAGASPNAQSAASGEASPDETPGEQRETPIERFLPNVDLLFPEGALDLKVSRLVNKVLFEGQVRYAFVSGDITAFLRYRYYGFDRTTQVEVFDDISFGRVERFTNRFDRTRGVNLFLEWPRSASFRLFTLGEIDRISSSNQALLATNNRTDTFVRAGAQAGATGDPRTQAIVGDTRAYFPTIFTAVREIGPGQFGFTAGLTYGFHLGSFDYVRLESRALKRFDFTARTFLVGTLHTGSFLYSELPNPRALDPQDRYSIPSAAFFNIGGADNLKGLSNQVVGTQEVHTTWELFTPWFLGEHRDFLRLEWQSWYWILYAGAGTIGFTSRAYTDLAAYIPDAGFGFESSVRLWRYRFFLSGIVARPLKGTNHVEARLSVRTYR
ncbi:MAG TPA: hypothetical protein VHG32_01200 [Thermoanaerobaculia bacterium]|nr:hypothetical protein [Thermoanaerobaculia bacterium]